MNPVLVFLGLFAALVAAMMLLRDHTAKPILRSLDVIQEDWLTARFGPTWRVDLHGEFQCNPAEKCHRVLRSIESAAQIKADGGPWLVKKDLLIVDEKRVYWHCLLSSLEGYKSPEVTLTLISELRARRALFNQRKLYFAAFGQHPHRDQLTVDAHASLVAKLERFESELHPAEKFAMKPIGQEFGAKIK